MTCVNNCAVTQFSRKRPVGVAGDLKWGKVSLYSRKYLCLQSET